MLLKVLNFNFKLRLTSINIFLSRILLTTNKIVNKNVLNSTFRNNIQRWYSFRTNALNGGPKANNTLTPTPNQKDPDSYCKLNYKYLKFQH